jgi:hypothetical protein
VFAGCYDHAALIPEVSRAMLEINTSIREKKKNEPGFCKEWGDNLVKIGVLKRKP